MIRISIGMDKKEETNHTKDRCFELIGYPQKRKDGGRNDGGNKKNFAPKAANVELKSSPIFSADRGAVSAINSIFRNRK